MKSTRSFAPFPDSAVLDEPGPAAESLQALARGLVRARGFALFLAVYSQPAQRDALIARLRAAMAGVEFHHIEVNPQTTDLLAEVLARAPRARGPILLTGLERAIQANQARHRLLEILNIQRPEWPHRVTQPVVLWIPELLLSFLEHEAPDFLDWRSDTVHFPGRKDEPGGQVHRERIAELKRRLAESSPSQDRLVLAARADWLFELAREVDDLGESPDEAKAYKQQALQLSRALQDAVSRPHSPVVAGYLRRLAEETRLLRMIGLAENLQIDLEIKDAYVPLRTVVTRALSSRPQGRYSPNEFKEAGPVEENIVLSEMFSVAGRYHKRGVILLGEPGAGKTTGARQLCWLLASGTQAPADLGLPGGVVPVFLRLRHLPDEHVETGFKDFVLRETQDADAPETEAQPGLALWNGQPRLWVFDGLDEVASEAVRGRVSRRLQDFLRHRPQDFVLVTSRYQGYGDKVDLGAGFLQFHVQPLKPDQVEAFVDKWFSAAYQELYGDKPKAAREAAADAGNLKRILNQTDYAIGGLRELRTNPLLLTVVCLVYHQEHALPRGRAALYEKCVTVLLESWRKELYDGKGADAYDPRAAQRVLAHLAWWMHCQGEGQAGGKEAGVEDRRGSPSAGIKEMAEAVARPLAETAPGAGLGRDGQRFIERMRDESGILVTAQPGRCSFLHLTFQEYLAATFAVEEGQSRELVERLDKSWWREVILLALARANGPFARQFFAALLDSPAWEADLGFASRCVDETAVTVLDPFLDKLRRGETPADQKLHILHLLRQRTDAALVKVCQDLVRSDHTELASLAREILARAGVEVEPRVVELTGRAVVTFGATASLTVGRPPAELQGAPLGLHVDSRTGLAFILLPAGEFEMGSNYNDREKPIHRVQLTQPFLLGKYPVTNQEYERFLKETKRMTLPESWDDKNFNRPQQPVVGVSWEDAQVFCDWAGCRLPTEAEWEYACRAGSKGRAYCFGDDEAEREQYAWYDKNSGGKTHPVGQKKPNDWGLYDVHGNVWEWCQDWYDEYPKGSIADPAGPKKGQFRVFRGGSWHSPAERCRSAYRDYGRPSNRLINLGFRVVLAPTSGRGTRGEGRAGEAVKQ